MKKGRAKTEAKLDAQVVADWPFAEDKLKTDMILAVWEPVRAEFLAKTKPEDLGRVTVHVPRWMFKAMRAILGVKHASAMFPGVKWQPTIFGAPIRKYDGNKIIVEIDDAAPPAKDDVT